MCSLAQCLIGNCGIEEEKYFIQSMRLDIDQHTCLEEGTESGGLLTNLSPSIHLLEQFFTESCALLILAPDVQQFDTVQSRSPLRQGCWIRREDGRHRGRERRRSNVPIHGNVD